MSGHSKWHNIRVKKTASDAKRGKIYTRHARLIEIAAQRGGDPSMNPSLRTAMENARADNVPVANIERAVKKGTGELKGERMEEILYAAYGPGGTAYLIECLSDNRNRTSANVKNVVSKHGGNFTETSGVQWMFERKGVVVARKPAGGVGDPEALELALIDAGAEGIDMAGDTVDVTASAAGWPKIRDTLSVAGCAIETAGLRYLPAQKTAVSDPETAKKVMAFMAAIEEDDDVSDVHTNAEVSADVAAALAA